MERRTARLTHGLSLQLLLLIDVSFVKCQTGALKAALMLSGSDSLIAPWLLEFKSWFRGKGTVSFFRSIAAALIPAGVSAMDERRRLMCIDETKFAESDFDATTVMGRRYTSIDFSPATHLPVQ